MTLTGAAATKRPDINTLTARPGAIVVHRPVLFGKKNAPRYGRRSAADHRAGLIDETTGVYRAGANLLSEAQRRAAGIRRNGRPRRPATPQS